MVQLGALSEKPLPKPIWWKNTYFWIAALLVLVGIVGMPFLGGEKMIRDPGQAEEHALSWIYFGAAVVMAINGVLSHRQIVQHYEEQQEGAS